MIGHRAVRHVPPEDLAEPVLIGARNVRIWRLVLALDAVELLPSDHAFLSLYRKRLPLGRIVNPLLQQQNGSAGAGLSLFDERSSGASIRLGFSDPSMKPGQVTIMLIGPARRLVGDRGEDRSAQRSPLRATSKTTS